VKQAKSLTREQLYELVWRSPVTNVAKDMGISDVALAKRCRREEVPLPPRGYWAKMAAGQTPLKSPLGPKPAIVRAPPKAKPSVVVTSEPPPTAPKPEGRRAERIKSRLGRDDHLETFWCKIDRYQREYRFGVNWHPHKYNRESWRENDCLIVFATIRSKTRRPYSKVELRVIPADFPRQQINHDLKSIGGAWTERQKKGSLICSAHVPADAFHGICEAMGRNDFVELVVEVRNLQRGHGSISGIDFDPEPADLPEDE
jgi:hypothetical protein